MGNILQIQLLGNFTLTSGKPLPTTINTPRFQALLTYLLVHRASPQSRSTLSYLFWPDSNDVQARTNLRNLVHLLTRALPDADRFLHRDTHTLQWRMDAPCDLDLENFEKAISQAKQMQAQGDISGTLSNLELGIAFYRGDLLPNCYADWILPERERLRQLFVEALEMVIQLLKNRHDYPNAIRYAQELLHCDPLHESTYRVLMQLHTLNGNRAGTMRVYQECVKQLRIELDIDPSTNTRQLYENLVGSKSSSTLSNSSISPKVMAPLIGRESEWAQLGSTLDVAVAGRTSYAILKGGIGIGKTRLLEKFHQWATQQEINSAMTYCSAGKASMAFTPLTSWLRAFPLPPMEAIWLSEISRLLPDILAKHPTITYPLPIIQDWQRQRLYEALVHTLLPYQPLLLLMDDMQWCDNETLEWLQFLQRYDPNARLLVVGAIRPEGEYENPYLAAFLQSLRHYGQLTEIELSPLDETYTQQLATSITGRELGVEVAGRLYQETEGNPWYVVETVKAAFLNGSSRQGADGPLQRKQASFSTPPVVIAAIHDRMTSLSTPAQEIANLAAVIGKNFSYEVIKTASGMDEAKLVDALDELQKWQILSANGGDTYHFFHHKIQEVVYTSLSIARQKYLENKVAISAPKPH